MSALPLREGGGGLFPDLPKAASTGPASELRPLALDGPSAGPNPGEASCPACETLRPAAEVQTCKLASPNSLKDPTPLWFLPAAAD